MICELNVKSLHNNDIAVSQNGEFISIATFSSDANVWKMEWTKDGQFKSCDKILDFTGHHAQIKSIAFSNVI